MLNEISSWFLNIRFFLLALKMTNTKWYKYNALCFFLSFLFCRIIFNSVVAIWVWRAFYSAIKDKGVRDLKEDLLSIDFGTSCLVISYGRLHDLCIRQSLHSEHHMVHSSDWSFEKKFFL